MYDTNTSVILVGLAEVRSSYWTCQTQVHLETDTSSHSSPPEHHNLTSLLGNGSVLNKCNRRRSADRSWTRSTSRPKHHHPRNPSGKINPAANIGFCEELEPRAGSLQGSAAGAQRYLPRPPLPPLEAPPPRPACSLSATQCQPPELACPPATERTNLVTRKAAQAVENFQTQPSWERGRLLHTHPPHPDIVQGPGHQPFPALSNTSDTVGRGQPSLAKSPSPSAGLTPSSLSDYSICPAITSHQTLALSPHHPASLALVPLFVT
ncbi:hypothetical protein P7K49_028801 [Saguinus oedipus]|uniref:Period 3 n=1 Tax=Saguinus oedipus TaxID=9490 RepID=A0ABQ9U6K8_SAGOE|nr:hypothetical protein P7K49_028801 [Saguinus oedipus]